MNSRNWRIRSSLLRLLPLDGHMLYHHMREICPRLTRGRFYRWLWLLRCKGIVGIEGKTSRGHIYTRTYLCCEYEAENMLLTGMMGGQQSEGSEAPSHVMLLRLI